MKRLIIIGASGHGKVVADIAENNAEYKEIVFLDDAPLDKLKYPIIGNTSDYDKLNIQTDQIIVAIGNAKIREKIQRQYKEKGFAIATLIHPNAVIANDVVVGEGTVIMAGAIINANARIGKGCIINTSSSVDHDCIIKDFVHVSVGVHLAGNVLIGNMAWIGIGSIVSNNVSICDLCMIGAGALVIDKIEEQGTYVGCPARKLR